MIPLGPRVAVERQTGEQMLASGLVLPLPDQRHSFVGTVVALGSPYVVREQRLPLDVEVGNRILYSSRCDAFALDDGRTVDIVDANSVIATL